MDRPVDPRFSRARSRRRVLWAATFVACVLGAAYVMQLVLGPSIRRDRVRTARVERGPVDATISATGLVLPEVEQVVTTPVDARVVRIRHRAGAPVREDDALVDLDVSQARLAVETLARDLAIKANDQARRRIALERSLIDIDGRLEVKRLQLAQFRAQLERARQLRAEGLLSVEDYRRSELAEAQAGVEVRQLQAERENAERASRAEVEGLALEMAKVRGEAAEARRLLDLAGVRADRAGVVTWSLTQEGVAIRRGDVVARLADLRAFRVEVSVSDVHAARLSAGQPAVVRVGDTRLEATVSSINPAVANGVVTVGLALGEPGHALLRPNLRVDAEIVTERRASTLRLRRGPFAAGAGTQAVFVVRGDRAVRTAATLGMASADYVEVIQGLVEGDEAIVSDMRDHASRREVRLR